MLKIPSKIYSPHIKKSLENPHVKYVKVFRGKTLKNEKRFTSEEEKENLLEELYPDRLASKK